MHRRNTRISASVLFAIMLWSPSLHGLGCAHAFSSPSASAHSPPSFGKRVRTQHSQTHLNSASTSEDASGGIDPLASSRNSFFNDDNEMEPNGQSRRDVLNVATHLFACLGAATVVSTWEDYDVTHLKPNRATLRQSYLAAGSDDLSPSFIGSATKGLAWNEADREAELYELQFGEQAGRSIQSYNEVMERHRSERVPAWKGDKSNRPYLSLRNKDSVATITEVDVKKAVEAVYDALRAVLKLKVLANDYDWDAMAEILDGPVLVSDLERAAATLQSSRDYLSDETREIIGFDWGACAWRHCGAAADAQESIAELRCRLGLFEPFECLFALDIVERSIRDMLAVIPDKFKPTGEAGQVEEYQPYQPRSEEEGNFDGDGDESDFLSALSALRSEFLSNGQN